MGFREWFSYKKKPFSTAEKHQIWKHLMAPHPSRRTSSGQAVTPAACHLPPREGFGSVGAGCAQPSRASLSGQERCAPNLTVILPHPSIALIRQIPSSVTPSACHLPPGEGFFCKCLSAFGF
jgi:hypothetical protein